MTFRFFLIYDGVSTEIDEPNGFDNFKPKLTRDKKSHGLAWEFAEQKLGFESGSGAIIEQVYLDDVDNEIIFLAEYQCNDGGWKEFYRGVLDFMQYSKTEGNSCVVNIGISQAGIQTVFKNRINNKVNIDSLVGFDGVALQPYSNLSKIITLPSKTIKMTSEIKQNLEYEKGCPVHIPWIEEFNGIYCERIGEFIGTALCRTNVVLPLSESTYSELGDIENGCAYGVDINSTGVLFKADRDLNVDININITGYIYIDVPDSPRRDELVYVGIADKNENFSGKMALVVGSEKIELDGFEPKVLGWCPSNNERTFSINYSNQHQIKAGDIISLYFPVFTHINPTNTGNFGDENSEIFVVVNKDSYFTITALTSYEPTNAKTYLLHESMSRATEIITNGQLTVKSDYYGRPNSNINPTLRDGCGSLRAITRGLNVRNAELTDGSQPLMEISIKMLLDSLIAIDNIGYSIDKKVLRVEPYEYFYNDEILLVCSNVSEITREVIPDRCIQLLNIGYSKWEAEEYNGIDGFHGKRQYRTKLKINDAKVDQYSDLIADGYAIEATRRRQIDAATKDWRYDNDIFIFDLRINNGVEVNIGVTGTDGTLIDETTIYNARLSPARMAMRWYAWMMQAFNNNDTLIYNGGEGYTNAKMLSEGNCVRESHSVVESQNIVPGDMINSPQVLFKHEMVDFGYPLTVSDFEKIRNNPHGLIEFDGEYGWVNSLTYDIVNGLCQFNLIVKK